MQSTIHGKNNFEWTERLCRECSDKQFRRSCELCGQIFSNWDYRKHLTENHSKEDIAKLQKKYDLGSIAQKFFLDPTLGFSHGINGVVKEELRQGLI